MCVCALAPQVSCSLCQPLLTSPQVSCSLCQPLLTSPLLVPCASPRAALARAAGSNSMRWQAHADATGPAPPTPSPSPRTPAAVSPRRRRRAIRARGRPKGLTRPMPMRGALGLATCTRPSSRRGARTRPAAWARTTRWRCMRRASASLACSRAKSQGSILPPLGRSAVPLPPSFRRELTRTSHDRALSLCRPPSSHLLPPSHTFSHLLTRSSPLSLQATSPLC